MTARRAATFLATLGALVMSSGIALMVTATSANADEHDNGQDKFFVCKYTGKPGVDEVLQGGDNPISIALPQGPGVGEYFGDGQDESYVLVADTGQEEPSVSTCPAGRQAQQATASATPVQATCVAAASYTTNAVGATFTSTPAAVAGSTITVTATANEGYTFDGNETKNIELVFAAAPTDCGSVIVSPPDDDVVVAGPTTKKPTQAVTPTVVSAGLGEVSSDLRGEQGLALIFAGMVLMVAAGGLGLRGRTSRI